MGVFSSDTKTNPFAGAEERMHKNMMSAEGNSVDETFALKMIEHHSGAIDAGEILLREGSDPEMQSMVQKSIEHQKKEIRELWDWMSRHGSSSS